MQWIRRLGPILCCAPAVVTLLLCSNPTDTSDRYAYYEVDKDPVNAEDSAIAAALAEYPFDEATRSSILAAWSDTPPRTVFDAIEEDYADGRITEAQMLLYKAYACPLPDSLPARYASLPLEDEGDLIFGQIEAAWPTIPADIRARLGPLMEPPGTPGSVYQFQQSGAPKRARGGTVQAVLDTVTAAGGLVVILFSESDQTRAAWVKSAVDKAYPMFQALFGFNINAPVRIYLIGLGNGTGKAYPLGNDAWYRVLVHPYRTEREVKSTAVHELFHVFQYSIPLLPSNEDKLWVMEATATWAYHYVYNDYNYEFKAHQYIFPCFHWDFMSTRSKHEYGSYLFFFHRYLRLGRSPQEVVQVLKNARSLGVKGAVETITDLNDRIKEYAVWNWNSDPYKYYRDIPHFPDNQPSGDCHDVRFFPDGCLKRIPVGLASGAIRYLQFVVMDEVECIRFDLRELNESVDPDIGVQALYKIGDQWFKEDWSSLDRVSFLRNEPEEKVDVVVLICSYGNLRSAVDGAITVDSRKPVWRGRITVTNTLDGTLEEKLIVQEELKEQHLGDRTRFVILKQEFSYTINLTIESECPFMGCTGFYNVQRNCSGTTTRTIEDGADTLVRFCTRSGGATIYFEPSLNIYGPCDYVDGTVTAHLYCDCQGSTIGGEPTVTPVSGECHWLEGYNFLGETPCGIIDSVTTLFGEEQGTSESGGGMTVTWNYRLE